MVKDLPAMREPWIQSLGWEDPLEKGIAAYSRIPAWRSPWKHCRQALVYRVAKSQTWLSN